MGTPITVDEAERSLYVRAFPRLGSLGSSDYDAHIEVYLPKESYHHIDHEVVTQLTKQATHWGFNVSPTVPRITHQSGHGPCNKYTLYLADARPDSDELVAPRLNQHILRQIVQATMVASGSAHIEELTLEGDHIATKITLMVNDGKLDKLDFAVLRRNEGIHVEQIADGEYTFYVRVTPDLEDSIYDPVTSAGTVAEWMGLFLVMPVNEPTRTPLYRTPDVVEAR
ncbi:MAG TPA: hypothetical protein VJ843_01280 [Candidatus Saccharimonadales bacterium]|nr:hypothetical protein [Candidatus Saccharimonadales bacterium]